MATRDDLLLLLEQRREIDGRFANIRRIGNGGGGTFSALVSADDSQTGARVAIKVCLPQQDRYRSECFDREAHLLEMLRGEPDIIQLVAPRSKFTEMLATKGGLEFPWVFQYYAIELANGDLSDAIASGHWSQERMLLAFRALCRAVQRIRGCPSSC